MEALQQVNQVHSTQLALFIQTVTNYGQSNLHTLLLCNVKEMQVPSGFIPQCIYKQSHDAKVLNLLYLLYR